MIRITLIELALVATPFLLFFAYRALIAGMRQKAGREAAVNEAPYQILFLSGAAFALVALFIVVVLGNRADEDPRDMVYIPPMVVGGEVQPGFFLPREEAVERGLVEARERDDDFDPDTPNVQPDTRPDAEPAP